MSHKLHPSSAVLDVAQVRSVLGVRDPLAHLLGEEVRPTGDPALGDHARFAEVQERSGGVGADEAEATCDEDHRISTRRGGGPKTL
jgi:hypothetical protein